MGVLGTAISSDVPSKSMQKTAHFRTPSLLKALPLSLLRHLESVVSGVPRVPPVSLMSRLQALAECVWDVNRAIDLLVSRGAESLAPLPKSVVAPGHKREGACGMSEALCGRAVGRRKCV